MVERKCKAYACKIQECLDKNQFDEKKCKDEVKDWRECIHFYLSNPPNNEMPQPLKPVNIADEEVTLQDMGLSEEQAKLLFGVK